MSKTSRPETVQKRETRSRHEKKRREEMNEVLDEMMELLPEDVQKDFRQKRVADQKPKKPDKCVIIGNAVEFVRKNTKKNIPDDSLAREAFYVSDCFLLTLRNFVISKIEGDHRGVFGLEKRRMIGKDVRGFLDFESGTRFSFLAHNCQSALGLRSFTGKPVCCKVRKMAEKPDELLLICVPDIAATLPILVTDPIPSPPPSKLEAENPLLAAMLRRKEPPLLKNEELEKRKQRDRHVATSQAHRTPIVHHAESSTASTSSAATCHTSSSKPTTKRRRFREENVIVESFPLKKSKETETTCTTTSTITTSVPMTASSLLGPVVNPYDVLAPGYREIWLRLQSERLLLEKRIVAKEGELKNLMLSSLPQYTSVPQTPQL